MKINELLVKNVYTTRPEDFLNEAAETMLRKDVGVLPVVDEQDKLLGMITDRDICMCALIEGRKLGELPVSLALSTPVFACTVDDDIADVHAAMQTHQVHRLPVVDKDEKLLGLIGWSDLLRATTAKKRGMTATDLHRTLTLISEPRELAEPEVTVQPRGKQHKD
jgi:CBS-domain-containing membrane protein